MDIDGLLEGLEGDARREREELVRWLVDEGYAEEEIRDAASPMLVPAGRVMSGEAPRLSLRELAEETGLELELAVRLQRSQGQVVSDVDAKVYVSDDLELARLTRQAIDLGFETEDLLVIGRVLAHGLAQAAEAMRAATLRSVLEPGASEIELAQAYAALVQGVTPLLAPMLSQMLRVQLSSALETEALNADERAAGQLPGAREVSVCFADVVGFTRLGEQIEPGQLGDVARRLEELARDVVVAPVRLVKTIGDAVMLVSPDAGALLSAAFALVESAAGEEFELRAGLATGPAISRSGDWFGRPVNLASRVTATARPGSVLVAESTHDALAEAGLTWSFAGERKLKGVGAVKLFRARPADAS